MIIAVNTRELINNCQEGYGNFIAETFKRIVRNHPEHEFIFIFDRPFDKQFLFAPNVRAVVTGPAARHPLLWKYWYDFKIPAILKKYKAAVFVSCDGFCSLRTKVPQCLVIHDLAFLHYPSLIKKAPLFFYKKYMPEFINKASSVATVSEYSKNDILNNYKAGADKIKVVYSAAKDIFHPLTDTQKIATKNKYTDGKEYFVYTGDIHPRKNLVTLLKAFSVFKKMQKTNMKLVFTGRLARKYESFVYSLKSYKYRHDVVMTGYVEETEMVSIIGAAYGLIYPSLYEGFGVPVIEAMKCNVPVITSSGTSMQEIAKEAALYADAGSYSAIADKMMLLYKDENLIKELVQKGEKISSQYSWDTTAELLWQSILSAVPEDKQAVG